MNRKLAFWGCSPPPIGGMTVHIKRLSDYLKQRGWDSLMYNFSGSERNEKYIINVRHQLLWYLKLWVSKSPKIHYVISTRPFIRFLASLLVLRGKRVVIRIGGRSLEEGLKNNLFNKLMSILSLKLASAIIGVNQEIVQLAKRYTANSKVNKVPGFISPQDEAIAAPESIEDFFDTDDVKIVVTGQISKEDDEDIYGLWDIFNLVEELSKKSNFKFRILVVSYSIKDLGLDPREKYEQRIKTHQHSGKIKMYHNEGELWPILRLADVFIRPTYTDGDANSIREAMYLGLHCVASDVVIRPEGVLTFKLGDIKDFGDKIFKLGDGRQSYPNLKSNAEKISEILTGLH